MTRTGDILVVGGYGEVGRRIASILDQTHRGSVIVAGRNPDRASSVFPAKRIDVDDQASIETALGGVDLVVACVRQREPYLLRAAVRRGIAYTSIAPPWIDAPALEPLKAEAERTGARIILAAGIEPGISSVLARIGADRLGGRVDAIETALLLGVGDEYGADSMAFILDEIGQRYSVLIDGRSTPTYAFERPKRVDFPSPIGTRRAYTMPFRDQLYYPTTLGARTCIARLSLDPPWLGGTIAALLRVGARSAIGRRRGAMNGVVERLRRRYAECDRFALIVDVRRGDRVIRSTLVDRKQAHATAVGAAAIAEALASHEVAKPGVWLAEQVIDPALFLERIGANGLVPVTVEG